MNASTTNNQDVQIHFSMQPSQLAVLTATVLVVIGVALALIRLVDVLILLFIGLVITATLKPLVSGLRRQGVPKPLAVLLIYLTTLGVFIGIIFLVVPVIVNQAGNLVSSLPQRYADLTLALQNSSSGSIRSLAGRLPSRLDALPGQIGVSGDVVGSVLGIGITVADMVTRLFTVLVIGYYLTMDQPRLERFWLSLAPAAKRPELLAVWRDIESRLGSFVRGDLLLMTTIGSLASFGYWIIGLPSPLVLGTLAGLLEAVPLIGPTLGSIPAILVALSISPQTALLVAGYMLILQVTENNIIGPRLLGHSVGVSPIVVILAIFSFGSLLGIAGAFLAIPLAAIFQVLMDYLILKANVANTEEQIDASAGAITLLRSQIHKLRHEAVHRLRNREDFLELSEGVDSVDNQVDQILTHVDSVLTEASKAKDEAGPVVKPEVIAQVDQAIGQVNTLLEQAKSTVRTDPADGAEKVADEHLDRLVRHVDEVGRLIQETKQEAEQGTKQEGQVMEAEPAPV